MASSLVRWTASLLISAFAMVLILAQAAHGQEAAGQWHGALSAGGMSLRLGVTITRDAAGALSGALTSPDQTPQPIPLGEVKVAAGVLTFTVPAVRGGYEGKWDASREAWVGTWTQGAPLPLVLEKGPVPSLERTQVPAKPYPYREEEVAFDSAPGVRLAGTLTLPPGKGPFPAAVLITGSGPQNRDEELLGHKPFLVLADHLTRKGVAVLRYDDRGFGKSTGAFATATSGDFALDAEAAAAFLRTRPKIDARRIGLIGHSEGGLIAPMVAVKDPKIAYVVLLAGPGAPSTQLMAAQRRGIALATGAPAEAVEKNVALWAQLDAAVSGAADLNAIRPEIYKRIVDSAASSGASEEVVRAQATAASLQVTTPWYREFIRTDPRPVLSQVRQPILAINGSKDLQVTPDLNLAGIREATKANKDVTVREIPNLNHLFQTTETGSPLEYGKIAETFSPVALEVVSSWVLAHTRR